MPARCVGLASSWFGGASKRWCGGSPRASVVPIFKTRQNKVELAIPKDTLLFNHCGPVVSFIGKSRVGKSTTASVVCGTGNLFEVSDSMARAQTCGIDGCLVESKVVSDGGSWARRAIFDAEGISTLGIGEDKADSKPPDSNMHVLNIIVSCVDGP